MKKLLKKIFPQPTSIDQKFKVIHKKTEINKSLLNNVLQTQDTMISSEDDKEIDETLFALDISRVEDLYDRCNNGNFYTQILVIRSSACII